MGKINCQKTKHPQKSRIKRDQHFWREMLKDFTMSGLTKRQFCRQQGLVVSSFYKWQHHFAFENIAKHEEQKVGSANMPTVMFSPVEIKQGKRAMLDVSTAAISPSQVFVKPAVKDQGSDSTTLVVEFGEYHIVVPSGFSTKTLRSLLEVLRCMHA